LDLPQLAIPPWSHNPEVVHTPDGKFVIYTLGPGKGKTHEKNCTTATPQTQSEQLLKEEGGRVSLSGGSGDEELPGELPKGKIHRVDPDFGST
jgi:hypothetical protein